MPSSRYLSTEAGKRRIGWAADVWQKRFNWHDLYARFRARDEPAAEETPGHTTGLPDGSVLRSVQSGAVTGRNRETLDRLLASGKIALQRSAPFDTAPGTMPSSFDWGRIEGMLCLAIGDALGNTTEGMLLHMRCSVHSEIRDYRPNRYAEGHSVRLPSDDSQMAFWTLDQINRDGVLVPRNLAARFASKRIFGRGSAVGEFVRNMHARFPWEECAPRSAGNGGLMRIAPVLIPHLSSGTADLWVDTTLCARITHNDTASLSACLAFVAILWELLRMEAPPEPEWWIHRFVTVVRDLEDGTEYTPCQVAFHPYHSFALWCLPLEGLWSLPKRAFGW